MDTIRIKEQKDFVITEGKGFQITFENGYTVSVQWGCANYCDNKFNRRISDIEHGKNGSNTAEVGIFYINALGQTVWLNDKRHGIIDGVAGYLTSNEVAKLIIWISNKKG